ncbi:hypothetical protein AWB81_05385 [Caballeronia arationis]|uniref:DUF4255 domain-containing protein n=1 Tax=Caballeronia arationis TaxID=1777142 RepID=UPI00074C0434|nr:DUF4255 domain-containing protein [Caballeronia arationis]SAK96395.1 hypothetical protein AWB81_05385 [Caballeronia arationis]
MAGLAAINQLGESIVALLVARRNLLAAEGKLGPIAAALDISQMPLSKLASSPEPDAGLTISCLRIAFSDYPAPRAPSPDTAEATSIALEVSYLATVWSGGNAGDEQSILTWAMLELMARPSLDRSVLIGPAGTWEPDETVQLVPESLTDDALFRLWAALQRKLRTSMTFRARVLRIRYGPGPSWPNVVATRFDVADVDDALLASAS